MVKLYQAKNPDKPKPLTSHKNIVHANKYVGDHQNKYPCTLQSLIHNKPFTKCVSAGCVAWSVEKHEIINHRIDSKTK